MFLTFKFYSQCGVDLLFNGKERDGLPKDILLRFISSGELLTNGSGGLSCSDGWKNQDLYILNFFYYYAIPLALDF
ncbi:hypothetical protein RIR_jg5142.t1 [Rhizophagus irregularis DAOM 181602=DAOM 197198]|nr:hypothetical protein RIR_jg5142.t1 [Rhizophagus irregularis DAOM 181602=DAOM 197198]